MSVYERVWAVAAEHFGKRAGATESLTPYSRTWTTIIERAEHALWVWNDKYGPLNHDQREYAADLICASLAAAGADAPLGDRYAFFHTRLTSMLNHERVDDGFTRRASTHVEHDIGAALDSLLPSVPA